MKQVTLKFFKENIVDKNFNIDDCEYFAVQEQTEVSCGFQDDVNREYCREHEIPVLDLKRDGGAIVHFSGNVAWAKVSSNKSPEFRYENIKFLIALQEYLSNKGIHAVRDNNDILIDGYKVASGCAINIPPTHTKTFVGVQININTDLELIKAICKKPMLKTPKALSDYGVGTEEIVDFIQKYFNK